jgi:hypothetical protein
VLLKELVDGMKATVGMAAEVSVQKGFDGFMLVYGVW